MHLWLWLYCLFLEVLSQQLLKYSVLQLASGLLNSAEEISIFLPGSEQTLEDLAVVTFCLSGVSY